MRFSILATALAVSSLASADFTFNITQAMKPGNCDKYGCFNNEKLLKLMPEPTAKCLRECQTQANRLDGCAEEDFACHCVNYSTYSDIIEPCAFPPNGSCTYEQLMPARPIIQDMCNYFNATLYTSYASCPKRSKPALSPKMTWGIIKGQKYVVSY